MSMIEVTQDIGDNRRCSITVWKTENWQILAFAQGLPAPNRVQDYLQAGKVIGQTYYFKIEELPELIKWLDTTGRPYRFKTFNEITPPSAALVKSRIHYQEQLEKAVENRANAKLKLQNSTTPPEAT